MIIYDFGQRIEYSPVSSVLDLVVSTLESAAAHLYWMDPVAYELRLVSASSTKEDSRIPRIGLEFPSAVKRWLEGFPQGGIASPGDPNFARFPETIAFEFSSLLAFPLREENQLVGILTLCRKDARAFGRVEMEFVGKLSDALVAAMKDYARRNEVDSLREKLRSARQENALLEKRLAERKLVERAKGLLQMHYGWTEEDAYYHLRKTSRQQRTPMALIAQRIIDVTAAKEMDRERLSA
jgi:hypothetical protein